jgi:2-phospho-L-lactate guanylyltransferase
MSAPCIVVPVKRFREAKRRLSSVATPAQRAEIAAGMCDHVLGELSAASGIAEVFVVSAEPAMDAAARHHGFELLPEAESAGLNAALKRAERELRARGVRDIGIVLADLPLFDAAEFSSVLAEHARRGEQHLTLVTDQHGEGTNVRLCRSRSAFPAAYGRGSAQRHHAAAAARGIGVTIVGAAKAFMDLDSADDVAAMLAGNVCPTLRHLLQPLVMSYA